MENLNFENVNIGGYTLFYIKDGVTKSKFLSIQLKDSLFEKFGEDLSNVDEKEMDEFIKK